MDDIIEFIILFTGASVLVFLVGVGVGSCNEATHLRGQIMQDAIEADEAHYCVDSHEWKFEWEQCDG